MTSFASIKDELFRRWNDIICLRVAGAIKASNHLMVLMHVLTILGVAFSSYIYSGIDRLWFFVLYLFALVAAYVVIRKPVSLLSSRVVGLLPKKDILTRALTYGFIFFIFFYPVLFMTSLGEIPLVHIIMSDDYYEISRYRGGLTFDMAWWHKYLKAYYLSAIAPFFILYLSHVRSKWFWPVVLIAVFFAANMIAKLYVVVLLLPLLIYLLGKKLWVSAMLTLISIIVMLGCLVYVTNPSIHVGAASNIDGSPVVCSPSQSDCKEKVSMQDSLRETWLTLQFRLLDAQGRNLDDWAKTFPRKTPYLYGCGYRFMAPLLGCDFVYVPEYIHDKINVELVDRHKVRGAVNSAHFMNDYANFGSLGIVLSAFLTCAVLLLFEGLYASRLMMLALTATPLLLLTEATLTSVLHSGGLILKTFLYMAARSQFIDGGKRGS